ncbi:zinc finger and BTB domain-containing protein 8A.1-B isoform X1 [Xenopus laevis]|uniref:Zinc finger and BTB domain-containing protein 8A.1-B isoform X1 n=1 Tax=Xenopus laevis TaxID=8355 RepID=A0A8J1MBW3_XENLA|nr:zinc finger and BTB domain-containing protein 8A.1-B isoform X1 [Xenopus laevis]
MVNPFTGDKSSQSESIFHRMEFSSHHIRLLQQLDEQRRRDLFCDCHIIVEGQMFKAHRNVLFASSGYFKMLLSQSCRDMGEPITATFDVFSADTFTAILDFVYSGKLPLSGQNVIEVMSAASYLQMTDVIGVCKMFIKSSLDINEKDRDGFFSLSDKDTDSNGSGLYAAGWRTESSPTHTHKTTEHGSFIAGYNYPPPISSRLQHPFSKSPRKPELVRKHRRRLLPEALTPALSHIPLGDLVGGSTECMLHDEETVESVSQEEERTQTQVSIISIKVEDLDATSNSWPESPPQESLDQGSALHITKAEELYKAMPTILGGVSGWGEDELSSGRFKCPFCTHTVKRKADLKRHLRCHTGERPYPCEACGKRFTRLEHLRNHFQTIHEAGKLICRRCKLPVTKVTGRVIQDGTRRYRLCQACLAEAGLDNVNFDYGEDHPLVLPPENEREHCWNFKEEGRQENGSEAAESDLVIQEVVDSEEDELKQKQD